ncbi:E3 ubiquitin-protein ligase DCST1 isoform X2 [Amphiprion ocellaris]|uniref:E3 ubiquitin-protein ligase DCST1 isoform X2 n=1 Tax=Amphiprion ocellaris TaxID=80972 RepID=UPI002411490A|nr:E3 ubiquitin-protein ligase DCST1 isoform X2 [Amphiprion ocellaris]
MMVHTEQQTPSAPHSTVQRFLLTCLPPVVHRFLFSQSEEFPVTHLVLRALFGALSGSVLVLCVAHNLPLTSDLKLTVGCVFVAVCAAGGALSSYFRCSILLMFPSMLGSRGRTYLMLLILSVLYTGPISNIQHNAESAALTLSCNLDLQLHHGRLLWREAIKPFILVTQQLMDDKDEFESETLSVNEKFQSIRDEIVLQYGYDRFEPSGRANSTQDQFAAKTVLQCDRVVNQGIQRCADWFSSRWEACLEAIPVPVINHILCIPMKFHFLCDVMRVMTPWCREHIPVEGNFGQLFDQLNSSVEQLSREFIAELSVQEHEEQGVLDGALPADNFTQAVKRSFNDLTAAMEQVFNVLQLLLSFTFITMFTQAIGYLRSYMRDINFDNTYITTYFRQIDARRRRAGKRFLLPLKKSEKKEFIYPWSLKIHAEELQQVTSGLFQVMFVSLLSVILLAVDFSLFHVLDIVSRHTISQFNLTSSHQVDFRVDGDTIMGRLLRTMVSAFNSSSSLDVTSDNSAVSSDVYISCACCVALLLLFSCLQVYSNRLRRVIAAFYHPKREKKRVLFLYNLQIQRRISSADSKHTASRGQKCRTVFQQLVRCWRRLC